MYRYLETPDPAVISSPQCYQPISCLGAGAGSSHLRIPPPARYHESGAISSCLHLACFICSSARSNAPTRQRITNRFWSLDSIRVSRLVNLNDTFTRYKITPANATF